jgi:hypothetical protein
LFGIRLSDPVNEKVRVVDFLVALVIMINHQLTNSPRGRSILRKIPQQLLRFYLYALKGLQIW